MFVKFFLRSMMGALAITTFALGTAEAVAIVDLSAGPRRESLFEAGLFFGGGYVPDYPGSDHNQARYLPLPYVLYRGSVIRADERDGVRARMVLAERLHLELSVSGSFPEGKVGGGSNSRNSIVCIRSAATVAVGGWKSVAISSWESRLPSPAGSIGTPRRTRPR